jgi:hypothetical protein
LAVVGWGGHAVSGATGHRRALGRRRSLVLVRRGGFYMLQPNQAAAITLFGDYRGTDRTTGPALGLPWLIRTKISVRVHNFTPSGSR